MTVLISIITATKNNIKTIADTLDSISTQTYPLIDMVWIDGKSTDGTVNILEKRYQEDSGTLISEKDSGIYDALNKGLELAKGDVIGFLHADDVLADNNVISDIAEIFLNPEIDVVYGDLEYVKKDNTNHVVRHWKSDSFIQSKLKMGWMPPHPTVYIRKSVYENIGFFNRDYTISADYDHMLRVFSTSNNLFHYIPRVLVRMRIGGQSNKSIKNIIKKSLQDYKIIRTNKIGGILTLILKNLRKIKQFDTKK